MSSYSSIERDGNGKIWRISQEIDGVDIPENSTFVAFDSVAFTRATGQLALIAGIRCDHLGNGIMIAIDNRDNRWEVDSTIENGTLNLDYKAPGASTVGALAEYFGHPMYITPIVGIAQHVDALHARDYIGDGPMSRTGSTRESIEGGYRPTPGAELATTDSGSVIITTITPH